MINVDKWLNDIGSFGIWHLWVFFWIFFVLVFSASINVAIVFMQDIPDFRCASPLTELTDWSFDEIQSISTPKHGDVYDSCKYFVRNYSAYSDMSFEEASRLLQNASSEIASCDSGAYNWHYTNLHMGYSIVNQWTLVCDQAYQVSNAATVYMAGYFVGCLIASFLSDRFGRKKVVMISGFLSAVLAVINAWVPNFYGFLAVRFLMSFFLNILTPTLYVLALELCNDSFRKVMGAIYWIFYSVGYTMLAGIAYVTMDWRIMHTVVSAPMFICPFLYWLIPESPRWLVSQGREDEAIEIFERAAKWNKKSVDSLKINIQVNDLYLADDKDKFIDESKAIDPAPGAETTNFFVVFTHWRLALRTINIFFLWLCSTFVYYGLSYLITSFSGSVFANNAISGALEAPAYLLCYPLLLWARKKSWALCFLLAGVTCLLYLAVPASVPWAQLLVTFIGKFAITAGDNLKYIVPLELYSTNIRGAAVSLSSMSGRIGAMIAPWVVLIAQKNKALIWVSMSIFGATSLVAGVLTLLLPESQNQPLPETLEETIHYPPKRKAEERLRHQSA